ncbi:DUF4199 domain-containing protein [Chitinophaga ginsengisegetis]|uniref:DUF4199 domain-containing protein n=1 Tax=Chitinophaga ginsengisegetis TaxID=393003 RepID=UPI000DBA58A4|nr:DUF4199 domain-containing protein [Chitinophaga ginsengisegetis]MDR6570765.1 hypothetical protein [Chitinophaga ginsengisegetis]MDR6650499.1 hypothetical protein [Chitinophaga ginsengisegetis]MDR6656862.1 hypothetical protein [Chitinophaga ginsengisegetis]
MRKNALVFGTIAGVIVTAMMLWSVWMCYRNENFEGNMVLGFAIMILAFSMIFVAVKNYRDKYLGGSITFGKAFLLGLYVTLVASTIYVVVWLVDYYVFVPDFMDKYTANVLRQFKAAGHTPEEVNKKIAEMANYKEMYKSPLMVVLITYSEILPVGLIITLLSSFILKRKQH